MTCDSSFHDNHLEGEGQNVLEREDEHVKGRSTNEKIIQIQNRSNGLIEPSERASKDYSSENYVEKPSLEGYDQRNLDSRKLVNIRDDDENFVRCTQMNSKNRISGTTSDMVLKVKDASPCVNGM